MAIGDAGAAQGLTIYPNTQSRALGFQNDNQRADDIAATMDRLDAIESLGDNQGLTPFTPVWSGLTPGSGSVVQYAQFNMTANMINVFMSIKLGTSPTVGDLFMSFPTTVTGAWLGSGMPLGTVQFVDSSSGIRYQGVVQAGATQAHLEVYTPGTYLGSEASSSSIPFVWAVNDLIQVRFSFPTN